MPGDVGLVAKLIDSVFSWVTGESGLAELKKKRAGVRLEEAANDAFMTYSNIPTDENWKAYQDAKAALVRHSTTP